MKLRILLIIIVIAYFNSTQSQTIKLIPNPDTLSEGFSGYAAQSMNGAIYTPYKNTLGRYQLAKFDGKKTILYPNPDTGSIYQSTVAATGNQLLFLYQDSIPYVYSIVRFDGKKVSHIPMPAQFHFSNNYWYGKPFINFNNNLYTILQCDTNNNNYLAKYDTVSNGFIVINNPPGIVNNQFYSFSGHDGFYVYNNKLYMLQNDDNYNESILQFDGNTINLIPLKDTSSNIISNLEYMIGYNGNLYFVAQVFDTTNSYHLFKYDGNIITTVLSNPANTTDLGNAKYFVVYNNKLFFNYYNKTNSTYSLGWYDGSSSNILNNPDNGVGISNYQFTIYKNALYFTYTKVNGKNYMAKFDGTKITIINNPDTISKGSAGNISFDTRLYIGYYGTGNNSTSISIGRYTDTGYIMFKNPDSGTISGFGDTLNTAFYFGYNNAKGKHQIAMVDSGITATPKIIIEGKTITPTGKTIKKTTVNFTGDGAGSDNSDSSGNYIVSLYNGNYTLAPSKNNDINKTNGVTTLDLALTQSHILGKTKLNNPYKIIAADVNGDGKITSLDLVYMKRLILGIDTTFTNSKTKEIRLWAFVDSSYQFPDTTNPFPFKDSISYIGLSANKTNQTFIGVKLGDVNWDWNPALARMPSKLFVRPKRLVVSE